MEKGNLILMIELFGEEVRTSVTGDDRALADGLYSALVAEEGSQLFAAVAMALGCCIADLPKEDRDNILREFCNGVEELAESATEEHRPVNLNFN